MCLRVKFQHHGVIHGDGDSCLTWALLHIPQMRAAAGDKPVLPSLPTGQITFHGKDSILSKFHQDRHMLEFDGSSYPTIENCYQAAKFRALKRPSSEIKVLASDKNPYTVKELSHAAKDDPRKPEWELVKIDKIFQWCWPEWPRVMNSAPTCWLWKASGWNMMPPI